VRLLLDTHALLWWLGGDRRLSGAARKAMGDAENDVYVSAATAWEITTKFRIGRLANAEPVAADVATAIADRGFLGLAISLQHGQLAGGLPPPQRDPFDRMLIAQAIIEQMPLVSNETVFDRYGVRRLW
jgi:PIN domain nuclease of toxin-antitoxin system